METERITQCRKPHGEEGIETIKNMNENHREISDFAFECLELKENENVLDIGCGGGVNIERFLNITKSSVYGLDYSSVSVKESIKHNQEAIKEGRCEIIEADVSNMPIEDESFDFVSAFETIYFWPNLPETFKEVYRIISKGGRFMIASGTDGHHPDDEKWLATVEGMNVYTKEELADYLISAGFRHIESFKKENDYILIVIAYK